MFPFIWKKKMNYINNKNNCILLIIYFVFSIKGFYFIFYNNNRITEAETFI